MDEIYFTIAGCNHYQFFGWIFALEKDVEVVGPDDVVEQMKKATNEFVDNYK